MATFPPSPVQPPSPTVGWEENKGLSRPPLLPEASCRLDVSHTRPHVNDG